MNNIYNYLIILSIVLILIGNIYITYKNKRNINEKFSNSPSVSTPIIIIMVLSILIVFIFFLVFISKNFINRVKS